MCSLSNRWHLKSSQLSEKTSLMTDNLFISIGLSQNFTELLSKLLRECLQLVDYFLLRMREKVIQVQLGLFLCRSCSPKSIVFLI